MYARDLAAPARARRWCGLLLALVLVAAPSWRSASCGSSRRIAPATCPFNDDTVDRAPASRVTGMTRILVVDNYDSFVFTIVGYLEQLGAECEVVRNDAVAAADGAGFDGVLVSPGPGTPDEAGVSEAVIGLRRARASRCSGCASATRRSAWSYGATVGPRRELMHGKTSQVRPRRHGGARRAARRRSPRPGTTR